MKLIFPICIFLTGLFFNSCGPSQAELMAREKMLADSIMASEMAQQIQMKEEENKREGEEHVFFQYRFLSSDMGKPCAEITVANRYSNKITDVVFIFSTSKNKTDSITSASTQISYLNFPIDLKSGDTLRTKINFKVPAGWRYGDVDKVFLYTISQKGPDENLPFKPLLKEK